MTIIKQSSSFRHSITFSLLSTTLLFLLSSCDDSTSGKIDWQPYLSKTWYIDCAPTVASEGTRYKPWNDFTAINATVLGPGDRILLKRGSSCNGMLKPLGSGSAQHPVYIDAYGDGALPVINAQGTNTAALYLEDMSHVVVQNLELTNPGDINDSQQYRGVYLTSVNSAVKNIVLRDLYIHDVISRIEFCCGKRGGAIISDSKYDSAEAQFDGILIENNLIEDVGRSGIYFDGTSVSTSERPAADQHWTAGGQNIVIRGNTLNRIQGDAIVAHGTESALIENNVVSVGNLNGKDFFSEERNCAVGIWAWNSNNTLIQKNEVSNYQFGQSASDGCDGTAFGADYEQDGTVIQYNYSHNNKGGFILLCSDDEQHGVEVRYNLSIDDGQVVNASPCKFPTIGTLDGIRIYNNTFITPERAMLGIQSWPWSFVASILEIADPSSLPPDLGIPPTVFDDFAVFAGDYQFTNNIVYNESTQPEALECFDYCSHNLFYNMPPAGTDFVTGDPLFVDPTWRGNGRLAAGEAFRLQTGSPAIAAGLGLLIPEPQQDYFGNAIPANPSIGMAQPE